MDCGNCGAPLSTLQSQHLLECDYCRSHALLPTLDPTTDRVVLLGQETNRSCPRCERTLHRALIDGQSIEQCPSCLGCLLRGGQLGSVMRARRAAYTGAELTERPVHPRALQRRLNCPGCRRSMEVHTYYGPGNAVIDSCGRCDAIWLDAGELTHLELAPGRR